MTEGPNQQSFRNNRSDAIGKDLELPNYEPGVSPTAHFHQQLVPPMICLTNRVEFTDRPFIARFIENILSMDRPVPSYIVLDFHRVVALETCVATFLAQQARRLALQQPRRHLIITGAKRNSEIGNRLLHGGLTECHLANSLQNLPDSLQDLPDNSKTSMEYRAFDSVELFLRISHSVSPQADRFLSNVSNEVDLPSSGADRDNVCISSIIRRLQPLLPDLGLAIWEILPGQAISCGRYAIRPHFLVLSGEVILHDCPIPSLSTSSQQPFRMACSKVLTDLPSWFTRSAPPRSFPPFKTLTAHRLYDHSSQKYACAHAGNEACWILEADPQNFKGVTALEDMASDNTCAVGGTKDTAVMKYCKWKQDMM
jgi:hypothetical protein